MTIGTARKAILQRPEKGRKSIIITGALFTVVLAVLYLYQPVFLRFLDNKFYDTLLRTAPQGATKTSGAPLIVDIDEKSLAEYGQWPWPRYRVALLLDKLAKLGAASIGLDIVFAESDRTSFAILKKDVYRDLKINIPLDHVPKALLDHDQALADTMAKRPFVLGYKFTFSKSEIISRVFLPLKGVLKRAARNNFVNLLIPFVGVTEDKSATTDCLLHPINVAAIKDAGVPPDKGHFLFHARDVICNLRILTENAASSGFFNVIPDIDGVVRRAPLLVEYRGKLYPNLALASLVQARGIKRIFLKEAPGGVESLRLDDTVVPLDAQGNLLIRYRGKGKSLDFISAADVLAGLVPRKQIEGRIVLLGTSATGLGDVHPTPVDTVFPGVEVQATIVDNILQKDFFSRPHWIPGLELMLVIVAGLFSTLLLTWTGALWSLFLLCLGALGLWQCSLWTLHYQGIFFSPIVPLIALGSNFSLVTLLKYWRGERAAKAQAKELVLTQDFTIRCLASLTECRDSETGEHIIRTQRYVLAICRQLATRPEFSDILDSEMIEHLYKSTPLHDIGKVGVPDHILLKPGKLTPAEFVEMKKHTTYGRDAIQRAEEKFGFGASSKFLSLAKEIAYTHHEKWDGSGYPEGLKGENIPLSGRIMALADVYDALVNQRVYKPAFTHEDAVALIVQLKGVLFDPQVVTAFLKVQKEFKRISKEPVDSKEPEEIFTDF